MRARASGGSANDSILNTGDKGKSSAKPLATAARQYAASKSTRELARVLGRQARKRVRGRTGRRLRASDRWQKWEVELLSTEPDSGVALQIGRSVRAVYHKRR